jgi:rhodanese-related sulfurtransferase
MQKNSLELVDAAKARQFFQNKVSFTTGPVELSHLLKSDSDQVTVIDVREAEDYAKGHIPGAINLPSGKWESGNGLSKDKNNMVYCYTHVCHLAANACVVFASRGFPVMEMDGGFEAWKENDLEIEHQNVNRLNQTADRTQGR